MGRRSFFQGGEIVTELTAIIQEKPVMLTVRQAAATGVLPERTIRRLIAEKKIPILRSGRTQYINYGKLLDALNNDASGLWERGLQ
jgi:excisionase family DNA binding protein